MFCFKSKHLHTLVNVFNYCFYLGNLSRFISEKLCLKGLK